MQTIAQYLPSHPFFAGLDDSALDLMAGCATNAHFHSGQYLFREGQPADTFYVIRHGLIALEFRGPTGSVVIDTADEGDVVGWSWLVAPYRWTFDARAGDETSVISFDGACLRGKCEQDPVLGYDLLRRFGAVIVERLHATRLRLIDVYGHVPSG